MSLDPRFDPILPNPKFDIDSFTDLVYDEEGNSYPATISYESFYYDGSIRVCKLSVSTSLRHVLSEDVVNLIQFREGKSITLECNLEIL